MDDNDRPSLEKKVICKICGWKGTLRDCKYAKEYSAGSVIHLYSCPECGADIYCVTEDKPPDANRAKAPSTSTDAPQSFSSGVNKEASS